MAAINSIVASRTLALGHGHLPTKRSINLAGVTEKKINLKIAIPAPAVDSDMISRVVEPYARIDSWGLNSNQLTMTITAASLTEVNTVSHSLQTEELVDFSTVTTASTREMYGTDEAGDVTANIVVYLKSPVKGGEDQ